MADHRSAGDRALLQSKIEAILAIRRAQVSARAVRTTPPINPPKQRRRTA